MAKRPVILAPDGGYGWVVVLSGFMLNLLTSGNFSILGIFLVEFLHHFQTTKATVTWIGAIQMCVGNVAGLLIGPALKRFGPRRVSMIGAGFIMCGFLVSGLFPSLPVLYLFYGAVSSVGFISIHMAGMVAVNQYFDKRRALANGLFMTGFSIGTFALPPLVRLLIDHFTWQGSLIIVSGIMFHGVFFGALLRPLLPQPASKRPSVTEPEYSVASTGSIHIPLTSEDQQMVEISPDSLKVPVNGNGHLITSNDSVESSASEKQHWTAQIPFVMFLFAFFLIQMGHMSVYTYTPMRCDAIGIPKSQASILLALMGILGLGARPLFGWLGDRPWTNRTVMFGFTAVIVGAITLTSTRFSTFPQLIVTSSLFGFINAGYIAVQGAVLVDTAGISRIEVATGMFMCDIGLANFCLHTTSGYIMDLTGSTKAPFLLFGSAEVVGGLIIMGIPYVKRYVTHKSQQSSPIYKNSQHLSSIENATSSPVRYRLVNNDDVKV